MEYEEEYSRRFFSFPEIESPVGLHILPIEIETSTWMKGFSFDEFTTSITRPTWADI
jgi:hypothetical protein